MTDKEILEEIEYNVLNDPFTTFNQDSSYESVQIKATAIEELVKRFKKQQKEIEKLKSKKYIFNAETKEIKEIPISDDYISKDKIKAIIEEITSYAYTSLEEKEKQDYAIYELKRLLEE